VSYRVRTYGEIGDFKPILKHGFETAVEKIFDFLRVSKYFLIFRESLGGSGAAPRGGK
jgi:hypothetical protein